MPFSDAHRISPIIALCTNSDDIGVGLKK